MNDYIEALAAYLDEDIDDFSESNFDSHVIEGLGNTEYWVGTYDEAERAAQEDVKSLIDDMGLESFSKNFQEEIINNYLNEDALSAILDEEIEYYENEDDTDMVEYVRGYENNPADYFIDTMGYTEFSKWATDNNLIDWDAVAEEVVRLDGPENSLASYDGNEMDLGNGLYGYRMN